MPEPNATFARGARWGRPFFFSGEGANDLRLRGLLCSLNLSQLAVERFDELARGADSTAVWTPIQSIVVGHVFDPPERPCVRSCGTTNKQLATWREQAVNEVLEAVEGKENPVSERVREILERSKEHEIL